MLEPVIEIKARAAQLLALSTPFCLLRRPDESALELYVYTKEGSTPSGKTLLVSGWNDNPAEIRYSLYNEAMDLAVLPKVGSEITNCEETSFQAYTKNFNSIKDEIKNGAVQKAILSRIKREDKPVDFAPLPFFTKLGKRNPNAFTYLILHPSAGLWVGATPEYLLKKRGEKYQTMSLAGTKSIDSAHHEWSQKDRDEQEWVSRHLREVLAGLAPAHMDESSPKKHEAGEVAHLKTVFDFNLKRPVDLNELLKKIHPTPAVGGWSVAEAIDLIYRTEAHERLLYTGLIGTTSETDADIFVNLRCMKIEGSNLYLFVGGGITALSELEAEWQETENKAQTLVRILNE